MIKRQIFGEATIKIDGFDTSLLVEKLCHICKVISIYRSADSVFITVSGKNERKVIDLAEASGCVCEVISKKGAVYAVKKYIRRYGIAAGALFISAVIFFLSNIVMKIEVKGTDDEQLIAEIKEIMAEEGIKPGAYIPSQNFFEVSAVLFNNIDGVAWASVGSSGSVVTANVNVFTPKTDTENMRIPCDIVASKDAVIKNAEVKVGRLCVLIGDAVYKGQTLVSGVIERADETVKYYHAYANIIGQYEDDIMLTQEYSETKSCDGETVYRRGLKFFDLEIPLPSGILKKDMEYSVISHETPVKLLGLTLPFSVKNYKYTELIRTEKTYTPDEALGVLYERLSGYEKNILKDVKIISREIKEVLHEDSASLEIHYVLEGPVGEIREIFIK